MFRKLKIVISVLLCLCLQSICAQVDKQKKETKKDSAAVYKKIQNYSKKRKFTKALHKLLFRANKPKKKEAEIIEKDTADYDGKIIRKINIVTLDPFGHSITDSTAMPRNWGERTGNKLHLKTKKIAIYNLLLFKRNTPYDSYKVQESERLIRSQRYVTAVKIYKKPVKETDSVDVTIRVLDSWSTIPRFSISSRRVSVGFKEKDFFGSGQQLDYRFTNRFDDGANANDITYTVPNITNTYISATVKYNVDLDNNYNKSIDFERAFYSPLTKWAGGILVGQSFRRDSLQGPDLLYKFQPFKHDYQDFWLGKASKVFEDENNGVTNLIVSARFLNIDFKESPSIEYDPIDFYSSEKLILSGVGINTRKFVKETYIFRNGQTEDVPIGRIYGVTFGYQYKNTFWRPYVGAQFSFGNYYKYGFLSMNFEAGTFFHQSKTYQTAFLFESNYFTKLYSIGRWKLRQFVNPKVVLGINRADALADELNLNERNGLAGFNTALYGTNKMILSLQTQTYSPHVLWGFRMNPFFNYSIGVLGSSHDAMLRNKAYSKLTLGLLISNDYLVFSSFQLSLSYYPSIPFEGDNVIKTNTFETTDFGLQNFELAKPRVVEYR
jgi:hypothetical protein